MDTSKRKYMNIATTPLARLDEANLSIRVGRPYTTISARLINNLSISSPCLQCPKRHGQTSTVHTPFSSHPVYPVHTTPSQQSISMLTPTKHSPDERPHRRRLHIPQLLHSVLNLPLVRPDINKEHKRVVLLDLLHRALRVQGRHDRPVLVHPRLVRDALARVFGLPREAERLRAVEGHGVADLARLPPMGSLQRCLSGRLGLRRRISCNGVSSTAMLRTSTYTHIWVPLCPWLLVLMVPWRSLGL